MLRFTTPGLEDSTRDAVNSRISGVKLVPDGAADGRILLRTPDCERPNRQSLVASGQPVLVDAAFCGDAAEWQRWKEAGGSAFNSVAVVNLVSRLPAATLIRQQLQSGKLGAPGLVRLHRWIAGNRPQGEEIPEERPALAAELHLILSLTDDRPGRVFAVRRRVDGQSQWQIHLAFSSGAMAMLDFSIGLPASRDYRALTVIAARGAAYADDHANQQLLLRPDASLAVGTEGNLLAVVDAVSEFRDRCHDGEWRRRARDDWERALAVADLVDESLRSETAVEGRFP